MKFKIFGKIISGSYHYLTVVYQYIWDEMECYKREKPYDITAKPDAVLSVKSEKYARYMLGYIKKLENLKDRYVALMRVVLGLDTDKGQFLPKPKTPKLPLTKHELFTFISDHNPEMVMDIISGHTAETESETEDNTEKNIAENIDPEAQKAEQLRQSILAKIERIKANKHAYLEQIMGKNCNRFFGMEFFSSDAGQSLHTEIMTIKDNVLNLELYYKHEMHGLPLEISQTQGALKSEIQDRINHIDYYVTALKECEPEYLNKQYANTASCFDATSYSDVTDSDFNFDMMPETVAAAIEKIVPYRLRQKIFDFSECEDSVIEKMSQSASELTQVMQRYFNIFLGQFLETNIFMMPYYKINILCNHKFIHSFRGSG